MRDRAPRSLFVCEPPRNPTTGSGTKSLELPPGEYLKFVFLCTSSLSAAEYDIDA